MIELLSYSSVIKEGIFNYGEIWKIDENSPPHKRRFLFTGIYINLLDKELVEELKKYPMYRISPLNPETIKVVLETGELNIQILYFITYEMKGISKEEVWDWVKDEGTETLLFINQDGEVHYFVDTPRGIQMIKRRE